MVCRATRTSWVFVVAVHAQAASERTEADRRDRRSDQARVVVGASVAAQAE